MDDATPRTLLDRVMKARKASGVIWALQEPLENARVFDRVGGDGGRSPLERGALRGAVGRQGAADGVRTELAASAG